MRWGSCSTCRTHRAGCRARRWCPGRTRERSSPSSATTTSRSTSSSPRGSCSQATDAFRELRAELFLESLQPGAGQVVADVVVHPARTVPAREQTALVAEVLRFDRLAVERIGFGIGAEPADDLAHDLHRRALVGDAELGHVLCDPF